MHAVLPGPSVSLDTCYQEPNCSFGGHALTVSLWKPCSLRLTELWIACDPMGALVGLVTCPRLRRIAQHQSVFRQQEKYSTLQEGCQYGSIVA